MDVVAAHARDEAVDLTVVPARAHEQCGGRSEPDDLEILGPAARVFMSGEADAGRETQNLRVRVQPTLSESVAFGSAIATTGVINPAVGLAAYLVQKVLRDPVEKLFSFEYAVTGGWSDPKVEKISAAPAPVLRRAPDRADPSREDKQ